MLSPREERGRDRGGKTLSVAAFPLFALVVVSLAANLLLLTGPLFMLQVYDRVLVSRSVPTLVALFALVAAIYVFYALIEVIRALMANRFAGALDEALAGELFRAGVRLRAMPGGGQSDPLRDLDNLRLFVAGPGPLALFDLPWVPIYLAIVFAMHPTLGWVATAGATAVTGLLILNEVLLRRPTAQLARAAAARQVETEEVRENAESVLAMGMLDALATRWSHRATELVRVQQRAADRSGFHSAVTRAFRLLLQAAVLAAGAWLVILGELGAGAMIAASIITSRALAPVEQLVGHWRGLVLARQSLYRIRELRRALGDPVPTMQLPRPERTLLVRDLASGPDPIKPPLIDGVGFALEAGEAMGILGLSGSGKSSLVRALTGIWPVLRGEIRLDGSELAHFDSAALGPALGYLPQSVELIDGTVAENIARFGRLANSASVIAAAELTGTHEMIAALPEGYETRVGPRGAALSAGQRQRIGLARALYGDPFLIVLDEPNSNLDAEGDAALTAALRAAKRRGAIVVVVAHRPSAIAVADKVLYLRNGRQAAFGPRDVVLRSILEPMPTEVRASG